MAHLGKKNSSSVAKDRLKLVLIHDRAGTSPSSDLLEELKKELLAVISKYFNVCEKDFDLEIKSADGVHGGKSAARLSANVSIRSIKSMGRNVY